MPIADDLGNLIIQLNPYSPGMDIYVDNPNPPGTAGRNPTLWQIEVEQDNEYTGEWSFKGEPQTIARALRIKYRYPFVSPNGTTYWKEEYLLIGYEGGGI